MCEISSANSVSVSLQVLKNEIEEHGVSVENYIYNLSDFRSFVSPVFAYKIKF